jgi:hypothetical protein
MRLRTRRAGNKPSALSDRQSRFVSRCGQRLCDWKAIVARPASSAGDAFKTRINRAADRVNSSENETSPCMALELVDLFHLQQCKVENLPGYNFQLHLNPWR